MRYMKTPYIALGRTNYGTPRSGSIRAVDWRARSTGDLESSCLPTRSPPRIHLTRREQEVLQSVLLGKADKEIATDLGITVRTVRFHLSHLFEKLNVESRVQLILNRDALMHLNEDT